MWTGRAKGECDVDQVDGFREFRRFRSLGFSLERKVASSLLPPGRRDGDEGLIIAHH